MSTTAFTLAKELNEAGELEQEFDAISKILSTRQFTKAQIINYFEGIIGPLYGKAWIELQRRPTIEEVKAEISAYCEDTTRLIEHCMSCVEAIEKTPLEIQLENLRRLENRIWLDRLKKKDEENTSFGIDND